MTPSNGNIFRVTCPLWGESTRDRRIPITEVGDAELWLRVISSVINVLSIIELHAVKIYVSAKLPRTRHKRVTYTAPSALLLYGGIDLNVVYKNSDIIPWEILITF